jgi:hypothetical protein
MINLYLKSELSLADVAEMISMIALPNFERELRDGLNIGGGEYYKFTRDEKIFYLVCNDDEHLEVFVEEMNDFHYYCYSRMGSSDDIIEAMRSALMAQGVECSINDEA